jgi:hypothetical protein
MRLLSLCMLFAIALSALAFGQDTNFATGPQYLANQNLPYFARPISTPSLSLSGPPLEVGASNSTEGLIAGASNQNVEMPSADIPPAIDLFPIFYGTPSNSQETVISGVEPTNNSLQSSIPDVGVWQATSSERLTNLGYGLTLGQAATLQKSHLRRATRMYTNVDVDRLHGG